MPQSPLNNVVAHWAKLVEGLSISPVDFYGQVEASLGRREIPGLKTSRVAWNEGGVLSPHRVYLRVEGERHVFDICAAPFGTGFFFSSWVTKRRARLVLLQTLIFAGFTYMIWWMLRYALNGLWQSSYEFRMFFGPFTLMLSPFFLVPASGLITLWLVALLSRGGSTEPEAAILAVPGLSWIYERLFAPETYYRIDTTLMFRSAVHAAMMEAIDGQTALKGLRSLSEDDRKPIFTQLM